MATGNYRVTLIYDGYCREYFCETHYETVILFDALYKAAVWQSLEIVDTRTKMTMQYIAK